MIANTEVGDVPLPNRGAREGTSSTPLRCIYCRRVLSGREFSREHVVQTAFAPFKHTLVLHHKVCARCNEGFANTIDLELARSSVEGLERYRWNVTPPAKLEQFDYKSVQLKAKVDGDFADAPFVLAHGPVQGGIVTRLVPQVGVRLLALDGFAWFSEAEIEKGEWLSRPDIDWKLGIKALGDSVSVPRLRALLASQGVVPPVNRDMVMPVAQGEEITVQHEFVITDEVQRAIAKIAFNYLAFVEGSDFVLRSVFDPLRAFILTGEKPDPAPLQSDWEDVLPFKKENPEMRPVIHFVAVTGHSSHHNLLGQVTLFGFMRHTVLLAENFQDPFPEIPYGHLFNVKQKTVQPYPVRRRISHQPR